MHNNYYFLRQLSRQLSDILVAYRVDKVFSQVKNELIIGFRKELEKFYIKAHLDPSMCCLSFHETFSRAGKNSVDLFPEIIHCEVLDVVQSENDRSFYLKLSDDYLLLFKMYGNRSNIILLKNTQAVGLFKHNLKQDHNIDFPALNKEIVVSPKAFEEAEGNYKKLIPTLGNAFDPYFVDKKYDESRAEVKYRTLTELLEYLQHPEYYIHHSEGSVPKLVLFPLSPDDIGCSNPSEASNLLSKMYFSVFKTEQAKSNYRKSIQSQISKCESYIHKAVYQLEKLNAAQSYQNIGDLIMANMHLIKPHTAKVELIDFYTGKPVSVKLKPTLSPQLNAEKYYKKAKKQQLERDALKNNIALKKAQIDDLKRKLEEANILKPKQLKTLKVLEKAEGDDLPYHQVDFLNYEILIGKNAKKNEQLTFQTAKKDDLFLHAKDCPGSHVIIRNKAKQNFPTSVIEKAASFAAFYSKNKNEALCRVLYTPRKYVRKAKGKPPGTVLVDREKVILVKPEPKTAG